MNLRSDRSTQAFAALASVAYLAAGLAWIGFSDQLGEVLFVSREAVGRYQTWKGIAFISVTALLIYFLLWRRHRIEEALPPAPGAPVGLLLSALLLLTAAPLVGLVAWNLSSQTRAALLGAESLVTRVAATTAGDLEGYFMVRQHLLGATAVRAVQEPSGPAACGRLLSTASAMQAAPLGAAILDADGAVLCSSGTVAAGPTPAAAAAPRRGPHLGAPYRTPAGAWAFDVDFALAEAAPYAVARVSLPVSALEPLMRSPLPAGSALTILHGSGVVLARIPDGGLVGTTARPQRVQQGLAGDVVVAVGRDSTERVYAGHSLESLGLRVVAGISSSHVYGPVRQGALQATLAGLLVVLAGGIVVGRVARRITQPMAALAQTAESVASGQFDRRAPEGGPREIVRVAQQFNAMLDRLPALQRQLRESEERHRTLLQKLSRNVPGMIFQLRVAADGAGTLPFASEALQALFEVPQEEAANGIAVLRRRIHAEDEARVFGLLEESRTALTDFVADYRVLLPRAGERHYLTRAQPERQDDGAVLWYGCTVDVTELEQARAALIRLNAELEARVRERTAELRGANEALESFSWSIAHDLRAPLAALDGFSTALPAVLARGDTARAEHLASRIAANAAKMSAMVEGLLALSRAARGQLQEVEQDLRELALAVASELPVPPAVRLRVGELPVARVDPATMRQVFWNLMANAVKFTSRRAEATIEVGCEPASGGVRVFVRDNGAGFDPARADRLFGVFQRLHDEQSFAGTGVGLAIVRRVVEWHGGRVLAEGAIDAGATFSFTLPAERIVREGAADASAGQGA